jgi:hypothetical protein
MTSDRQPRHLQPGDTTNVGRTTGRAALSIILVAIAFTWTVVLPWLGTQPTVRAHIEHFDRQGIDPAALFYSDVPAMPRLEAELSATREKHPEAFWGGGLDGEE